MQETFEFIALLVLNYLLLGSLAAALVFAFTRLRNFNAATRHNIWCDTLLILVLMPALVLIPNPEPAVSPYSAAPAFQEEPWSQLPQVFPEAETRFSPIPGEAAAVASPGIISAPSVSANQRTSVLDSFQETITLDRIGALLATFIVFGAVLKLMLFAISFAHVRQLFSLAEPVDEQLLSRSGMLARRIGLSRTIQVRHTGAIASPLTGGILRPVILLPTEFYCRIKHAGSDTGSVDALLLHELAHIKRRDPLVAMVLGLLSVFLFWHPAIHFVNRQIRFERELACDDWVLRFDQKDSEAKKRARDYAESLVSIAESMNTPVTIPQTVACVNSSNGLAARIAILLNRKIDHSVAPNHLPNIAALSFFAGALLVSSAIWPALPIVEARILGDESAALPNLDSASLSATGAGGRPGQCD